MPSIILCTSHWLIQLTKNSIPFSFYTLQSLVEQQEFLSLQGQFCVVSRLWTRFSYSDCDRFCPRNDKKFSRNSCGSSQLVVVSRHGGLNNHPSRVPISRNQGWTMETQDEVLSKVGSQDMDTSWYQVSAVEDIMFHWDDPDLNKDAFLSPGIDFPFSP